MIKDSQQDQAKRFSADSSVNEDDDDDNEIRAVDDKNGDNDCFYDKLYKMTEKFAATRIGQFVIDRGDRVLRSIEETAKWSLPKDSLRVKLVRPYSWLIFITLIVMLRVIRIALSLGAFLIGNRPVTPYDMVYFLQTRRRKLRAIRFDGLKKIQRHEDKANVFRFNGTGCFTSRISALLSIAICQPGKHCLPGGHVFAEHGYMQNERSEKDEVQRAKNTDNNKPNRQPALELCDDLSDQDLTFNQMLNKYADVDSEEDPDFVPQPDEEESSDEVSVTSDSSANKNTTEEREDDVEVSNNTATQTDLQPENGSEENTLNGLSSSPERTNANKSLLDQSVEIRKSDNQKQLLMPKPIAEIKTEPLSDSDSGSKQLAETPKIREALQSDKAKPMEMITYNELPSQSQDPEKLVKAKPHLPSLGPTAVAGSPPNFDASVPTETVLKNKSDVATVHETAEINLGNSHSSPQFKENYRTSVAGSTSSSSPPSPTPPPPPPPPKKYNQQQSFKSKFRGRNRR